MSVSQQHILITGASGLVGSALAATLPAEGHRITRLSRQKSNKPDTVAWDATSADDSELRAFLAASPVDIVIHLAGAPVFQLWTAAQKKRIRDSRVLGTQRLAAALAAAPQKPTLMICASAIGYYGIRGNEVLTEDSRPGAGFLAETCIQWEAATQPVRDAGIRVVNLRIGIVLARNGGALKPMLPTFKLGLGAKLGNGQQWMSWIALEDLIRIIQFAMARPDLHGPINCVAPNPITNSDFTATLAKVLRRPAFLSVPEFILHLAPGGMADETLLSSERVIPDRLAKTGFAFKYRALEQALLSVLAES